MIEIVVPEDADRLRSAGTVDANTVPQISLARSARRNFSSDFFSAREVVR
jgi:hypothetical protein